MSKGKKRRLTPADVLDGRSRADVRDILSLIHDVNPSGHDHLPAREIAGRYALKSRLQSLLVRRFADELVVEPVADQPHIVTLRHRPSGVDACHAVIATLEDDARSWVQRAIDLGAGEDSEPPALRADAGRVVAPAALREPRSAAQLLGAARDAITSYDYERARELLEAAITQRSEHAAALLLELLVETLGADGEALALVPRLPDAARGRPDVRSLLALATARAGERGAALALLRGLPPSERAAQVFAALARRALEAGDTQGATRDLAEVRELSPAHPALDTLMAAMEALRAPLEEEAQRALTEGRLADAYARVDELLARFPESKVGRRIARHRDEEHRREEAARLLREAEEALAAGALGEARLLAQKARAAGLAADRAAGVEGQIAALEAKERARAEAARIEDVTRLLGEGDAARAFFAYLDLPGGARAEVRARALSPTLGWLDETGVTEGSGARAKAAVLAVQALARAETELTRDPRAALEILGPHRKALAAVPRGEAVAQAAEKTIAEERRRRALDRLEAAERAFAEGGEEGPTRAGALLAEARARDVGEEAKARLSSLERQIEGTLERRRRRRLVEELRRKNDARAALHVLEGLIEAANDPGERAEYQGTRVTVLAEIRTEYEMHFERSPAGERRRLPGPFPTDPSRSILPGGREVVLAQSHGGWVFLWVIDVASGEMRERVRMRTAVPLRIQRVVLESGRMVLVGTTGSVIELELSSWLPIIDSTSDTSPDYETDVAVAPGGRYTWVCWGSPGYYDIDVWDSKREAWCRESRDASRYAFLSPLYGLTKQAAEDPPAMAVTRKHVDTSVTFYSARGTQLSTPRKMWLIANTLVVHPCGETLLGVELAKSRSPDDDARFQFVEMDPRGAPLPATDAGARSIPGFTGRQPIQTVVDADAGLVFVRFDDQAGGCELLCMKTPARGSEPPRDGRARPLEETFRVTAPARIQLVEDPAGGAALAIVPDERSFDLVRLSASPPVFRPAPSGPRSTDRTMYSLTCGAHCDGPTGARKERIDRLVAANFLQPERIIQARILRARRAGPEPLLDLSYALHRAQNTGLWLDAVEEAIAAFPDHPEVLLADARYQIRNVRWDLTRERLERIDPGALEESQARHLHHLRAHAMLMTGDRAEALLAARQAERHAGICDIELALALATPGDDPDAAARAWTPTRRAIRELIHAVEMADARLDDGDPLGAIRVLDVLFVHEMREVQSLARLAEAHLAVADAGGIDPFDRALSLAAFCGAHAENTAFSRNDLPLFPRWKTERLDDLAARATAWLEILPTA